MNLDPRSIPYRAAERVLRFGWVLLFVVFSGASGIPIPGIGTAGPVLVSGLVLAALLVVLAWQVAVYQRFTYAVTADTLDIRSGVFSRREREIPLHRVQNVDTSQNLVQRVLGIVDVSVETAGGGATEARLRYLSVEGSRALREDLRRRKREADADGTDGEGREGTDDGRTGYGDDREPTELFAIQPQELALLGLVSIDLRLLSLAAIGVPVFAPSLATMMGPDGVPVGPLGAVILAPLYAAAFVLVSGLVSGAIQASNYYGFRLLGVGEELRYERGLFQRNEGTIPTEKIQALAIEENLVARLTGYATLAVETAGYAPGQGPSGGSAAAVPLTTRERCLSLARSIEDFDLPDFRRPPKRARTRYAVRYAGAVGFVTLVAWGVVQVFGVSGPWYAVLTLLALVPVAAHLKWANRGYALTDGYVLTCNGFWTRTTAVVPDYRVQTIIESRTLFQRRRSLATVTVDTAGAGGSRVARAVDIDAESASELRETVADRLQNALVARRTGRVERNAIGQDSSRSVNHPSDGHEPIESAETVETTGTTELARSDDGSESGRSGGRKTGDREGVRTDGTDGTDDRKRTGETNETRGDDGNGAKSDDRSNPE